MAKLTEQLDGMLVEVQLPHLFSKMKVSIDGREMGVGTRTKNVHTCTIPYDAAQIEVTLKQSTLPPGFEFSVARDGVVLVSRPVWQSGKEMDARLANLPKWMFVFPIAAGAPIFVHGLLPSAVGALGAWLGYKILIWCLNDRRKLIGFGILNIAVTYLLTFAVAYGLLQGLRQAGWLAHDEGYVRSTVEKTNATLPIKVDKLTTLRHASYEKDTVTLTYTIEPLDLSTFDKGIFQINIGRLMKPTACTDNETHLLLKNGYWIRYAFTSNGVPLGAVKYSKLDCR